MKIDFDPAKHEITLMTRGLNLADAVLVFAGPTLTVEDDRKNYGEMRQITIGLLDGRMVLIAWTQRGDTRRIISMRKANDREVLKYSPAFTKSGG